MTYGLYAGISAADLGWEPDEPAHKCPKCDGALYEDVPGWWLCGDCGESYNGLEDVALAEAYYLEQWDEAQSGPAHPYEEGL